MSSFGNANESNNTPEIPFIKDLMVQCGRCLKWRLIPSMEKYEILREKHVEVPFFCEAASDIPCPPTGWRRLMQVRRGECENFFADLLLSSCSIIKHKARSQSEVKMFLENHPEYTRKWVNMSQFSFKLPKRLDDYMKKCIRQEPNAATE
ncbi:hypothetical protein CARUB_v10007225mg, partial [Capsella rubella]